MNAPALRPEYATLFLLLLAYLVAALLSPFGSDPGYILESSTYYVELCIVALVLTMVIPLQYAVLVGVGISVILYVAGQSSRLVTRRLVFHTDGRVEQTDPPTEVASDEVIVLHQGRIVEQGTPDTLFRSGGVRNRVSGVPCSTMRPWGSTMTSSHTSSTTARSWLM